MSLHRNTPSRRLSYTVSENLVFFPQWLGGYYIQCNIGLFSGIPFTVRHELRNTWRMAFRSQHIENNGKRFKCR